MAAKKKRVVKKVAKKRSKKPPEVKLTPVVASKPKLEKRKKRTPRTVPIEVLQMAVRQQGAIDYITDPEQRTIEYHYERDDRDYREHISLSGFTKWAVWDKWNAQRTEFWEGVVQKTLTKYQDDMVRRRAIIAQKLYQSVDSSIEYLTPIYDHRGNVKIDKDTGKPMFALPLGNIGQVAAMVRDNVKAITELEGDLLPAPDNPLGDAEKTDPLMERVELDPEEAKKMSRLVLLARNPNLKDDELFDLVIDQSREEAIEAEGEEDDDGI